MRIGFIGAGNMGGAILRGYAPSALEKGQEIYVYNRTEATRTALAEEFDAVTAYDSVTNMVKDSDVVVLGVKPNTFDQVLAEISEVCTDDKLVVSMAAGISMSFIERYLGSGQPVIRIMPNTPAQVGAAMVSVS